MTSRPVLLVLAALTLAACGTPQATVTPSASQPASSASAAANLGPFACADRSGGVTNAFADLRAIRVAHQTGFDRITFEFAPWADAPAQSPIGLPAYELTQQATTTFYKDASGQPVTLAGTAGVKVVFHGGSGYGTYSGSQDLKPPVVLITEVAQLGDFERTLSWGIGLNPKACYRTVELSNPTRLAIDFQTPPAAG
jgi:hypothetical protein